MSTLTIIITAATFFLIGAGIGRLFARKNQTGDHSVEELEKKLRKELKLLILKLITIVEIKKKVILRINMVLITLI